MGVTMRAIASVLFAFAVTTIAVVTAAAQDFQTSAKQAVLMDYDSGSILFQKNADELMPPASMAKLMTMEVVFDALKSGAYTLESEFHVSTDAWKRGGAGSGGSTMFLRPNIDVRLEDLVKGVIVVSGNDASIAVAQNMAGSEPAFAGLMTQRARAIGLEKSVFKNSTGLPHPEQLVTARELAELARHIIRTYPEYYKTYYSLPEFKWGRTRQPNRNPLLGAVEGADGLKTGHTEASGYGLVGSAVQDGRRLILVLNGLPSSSARRAEAIKLMRWGQRAFKLVDMFKDGEVVGEATVFGGAKSGVAVAAQGPLQIYVPIGRSDRLRASIVFDGPLVAPVQKGDKIAKLQVMIGDRVSQETPLYAAEDVEVGSIPQRALSAAQELLLGWAY